MEYLAMKQYFWNRSRKIQLSQNKSFYIGLIITFDTKSSFKIMSVHTIPYTSVLQLSQRDILYQTKVDQFNPFFNHPPSIEGLKEAIKERANFKVDRPLLVEEFNSQYSKIHTTSIQRDNILSLLDEKTFTIVTAHQPVILTGPLFYILKIFSTINLAEHLQHLYPDYRFVPVFINGGEDHDFEEVNHINLFGKKIIWQHDKSGAVGRLSTEGFDTFISEVKAILGDSENAKTIVTKLISFKEASNTLNDFVIYLLNDLFAKYGLLILSMDSHKLKKAFVPYMQKELFEQASESLISETQNEIAKLGFHAQAFPREINLFYLGHNFRERIVLENHIYKVLNTDITFTKEQIKKDIETNPSNYSPNVVMRPLYQESILPNLAYVGGGGELAYWLERKSQFKAFDVFFPVLIRRNSAMILSKSQAIQLEKLNIKIEDIFKNEDVLINQFIENHASFDIHLNEEITEIEKSFNAIGRKAKMADTTLQPLVEAEKTKIIKQIEQIESRIKRSLKKNEETSINQIKNLKHKLTPSNGLQERTDNFFQFYVMYGEPLIDMFKNTLDPLNKDFLVFTLD